MKAFEIIQALVDNLDDYKQISFILPEFYSENGGDISWTLDEITTERQDAVYHTAIMTTKGYIVIYLRDRTQVKEAVENIINTVTPETYGDTGAVVCDLARIQVVNVQNCVAVIATIRIIEEN